MRGFDSRVCAIQASHSVAHVVFESVTRACDTPWLRPNSYDLRFGWKLHRFYRFSSKTFERRNLFSSARGSEGIFETRVSQALVTPSCTGSSSNDSVTKTKTNDTLPKDVLSSGPKGLKGDSCVRTVKRTEIYHRTVRSAVRSRFRTDARIPSFLGRV